MKGREKHSIYSAAYISCYISSDLFKTSMRRGASLSWIGSLLLHSPSPILSANIPLYRLPLLSIRDAEAKPGFVTHDQQTSLLSCAEIPPDAIGTDCF